MSFDGFYVRNIDDVAYFATSADPKEKHDDILIRDLLKKASLYIKNPKLKDLERRLYSFGLKKMEEFQESKQHQDFFAAISYYMGLIAEQNFYKTNNPHWGTNVVKNFYDSFSCFSKEGSKSYFIANVAIVNCAKNIFPSMTKNDIWQEIRFNSDLNLGHHFELLCNNSEVGDERNLKKCVHSFSFAADTARSLGRYKGHKGYLKKSSELYDIAMGKSELLRNRIKYHDNLAVSQYEVEKMLEKNEKNSVPIPSIEQLIVVLDKCCSGFSKIV
ncbi:hypothetical protein KY321_04765 [Candidatus Woesearchaeota archaeon]|nr:hypothetical protein [Candidatus Woesearchaeota archaeon]